MYAPVLAAGKLPGISVTAIEKNINTGPFLDLIKNATANQNAPDIAHLQNSQQMATLSQWISAVLKQMTGQEKFTRTDTGHIRLRAKY
jgi:hypothetical protein